MIKYFINLLKIICNMELALKIKKLRVILLITQQELANLLGVSIVTANCWEKGKYEPTMKLKRNFSELN
jgi:DNA-binding XRE family transcriptional regulator